MGRTLVDLVLIYRNIRVVLLVDIDVLHKALVEEVIKVHRSLAQHFKVMSGLSRLLIVYHYMRTTDTSFVCCDMHRACVVVDMDTDELGDASHTSELTERVQEHFR